jgi:hypothetical protein
MRSSLIIAPALFVDSVWADLYPPRHTSDIPQLACVHDVNVGGLWGSRVAKRQRCAAINTSQHRHKR